MIEDIFEMIMRDARAMPGKDFVRNIHTVLMEIHMKLFPVMENIREDERRKKGNEKETQHP